MIIPLSAGSPPTIRFVVKFEKPQPSSVDNRCGTSERTTGGLDGFCVGSGTGATGVAAVGQQIYRTE